MAFFKERKMKLEEVCFKEVPTGALIQYREEFYFVLPEIRDGVFEVNAISVKGKNYVRFSREDRVIPIYNDYMADTNKLLLQMWERLESGETKEED